MKYTLKNFWGYWLRDETRAWAKGLEKELRKRLRSNRPYGPSPMTKELIKEILGES